MTKLSEYKEIKELTCFDKDKMKEFIENAIEQGDYELDNYRIIKDDMIFDIMKEELENDEYILGCFNDWFLSDVLNIDIDVIQAMKKAEAFEAIGKLVLSLDKLDDLAEGYIKYDGYGHYFAHYDSCDNEIEIDGEFYHLFRVN